MKTGNALAASHGEGHIAGKHFSPIYLFFYLISIAVLLYFSDINQIIKSLQSVHAADIVIVEALVLVTVVLNALNVFVLWGRGLRMGFRAFFFHFLDSVILGKFIPAKIGDFSLAYLVKDDSKIGTSTANILLDKVISLITNLVILLPLSAIFISSINVLYFFLFAIVVVLAGTFFFSNTGRSFLKSILKSRAEIFEGFGSQLNELLKTGRKRIAINFALTLVRLVIQSAIILLVFRSLSMDIGITKALLLNAVAQLSLLLALTPGATGLREPIFVVFATALTGNYNLSLSSEIILIALDWLSVLIFIAISMAYKSAFAGRPTPNPP